MDIKPENLLIWLLDKLIGAIVSKLLEPIIASVGGAIGIVILCILGRKLAEKNNDKLPKHISIIDHSNTDCEDLGCSISLEMYEENREKSADKLFFVVKKGKSIEHNIPKKLCWGNKLWMVPLQGFDLALEIHAGEFIHSLRLHLDFNIDNNFAALVYKRKNLTRASINQIVAKEWLDLIEENWTVVKLNKKLEPHGLRCTTDSLPVKVERNISILKGAIRCEGWVFLWQDDVWQCWQDSGQFSVAINRFTRQDGLETLLPQRVVKTKKYKVEHAGKKIFFTFGKEATFGRDETNSICFPIEAPDPSFQRVHRLSHCTLKKIKGKLVLMHNYADARTKCNGQSLVKGKPHPVQQTFQVQLADVLHLDAVVRTLDQTSFVTQWIAAGWPLEVFFQLCDCQSCDGQAICVSFSHLPVSGISNPWENEVYYAVLI